MPLRQAKSAVSEVLPAARQHYGVQTKPGPQSMVSGIVQPEAVMAVKVRIRPRTTLYFNPDIVTPSVGEHLRPRIAILRVEFSGSYGD